MPPLSELPILHGVPLAAMRVSVSPERYVYGDPKVLAWLRGELLERKSEGMPPPGGMPNWR